MTLTDCVDFKKLSSSAVPDSAHAPAWHVGWNWGDSGLMVILAADLHSILKRRPCRPCDCEDALPSPLFAVLWIPDRSPFVKATIYHRSLRDIFHISFCASSLNDCCQAGNQSEKAAVVYVYNYMNKPIWWAKKVGLTIIVLSNLKRF